MIENRYSQATELQEWKCRARVGGENLFKLQSGCVLNSDHRFIGRRCLVQDYIHLYVYQITEVLVIILWHIKLHSINFNDCVHILMLWIICSDIVTCDKDHLCCCRCRSPERAKEVHEKINFTPSHFPIVPHAFSTLPHFLFLV